AAAHLHQFHLPQMPPAQAPQAADIHASMSYTPDFMGMACNDVCASLSPVVPTTAAAASAVTTPGVQCTRTLRMGLDGLSGMGGMGGVGGVGGSGMGEDELLVEAAAWLAEQSIRPPHLIRPSPSLVSSPLLPPHSVVGPTGIFRQADRRGRTPASSSAIQPSVSAISPLILPWNAALKAGVAGRRSRIVTGSLVIGINANDHVVTRPYAAARPLLLARPFRARPLTRPVVSRRIGRIDATRGADGGSGDRDGPVDERAGVTAADDASDKRPRISGESDSNGAANNEDGSIGDAARRIWDVSGRDLAQVALETSRATDGPCFLAPCGVLRKLPLLVYLPGLDGTGVFLERHLEGLKPCYDVRCLCIPAADTSSYTNLAQLVANLIRHENGLRSASALVQAAMGVGAVRYTSDDEMPGGTSTPAAPAPGEAEPAAAVTVVAESFGAGVALSLAATHSHLVAHLVICNSASGFRRQPALQLGAMLVSPSTRSHAGEPFNSEPCC
ncbi:unnamed protein product, partial [Closterium sp. NIES-54]